MLVGLLGVVVAGLAASSSRDRSTTTPTTPRRSSGCGSTRRWIRPVVRPAPGRTAPATRSSHCRTAARAMPSRPCATTSSPAPA